MTITYLSAKNIQGVAADTKPINVPDGTIFYETDTFTDYQMVSGSWKEINNRGIASYIVYFVSSGLYKLKNLKTGVVDASDSTPDAAALIQTAVTASSSTGARIYIGDAQMFVHSNIDIPQTTASQCKPWVIEGVNRSNSLNTASTLRIGSGFTDGEFLISSVSAGSSGTTANLTVRNLNFTNASFAKTGGVNNTGGTASPLIDAGFINIESDTASGSNSPMYVIENCGFSNGWRAIRIAGQAWYGHLNRLGFESFGASLVADYDIMFQNGSGHNSADGRPKLWNIGYISMIHTNYTGDGHTGSHNYGMVLCGGYHHVDYIFNGGAQYNEAPVGLYQCFSSTIDNYHTIDMSHNVNNACLVFDTESPDGDSPSGGYSTYNNQVYNFSSQAAPKAIKFANGAFRNNITAYAYWGGNLTIDDAGAGIENIIELINGAQLAATPNTKITSTNSLVKIIDKRLGANNKGLSTQSGDGSTKVFNISHSCFTTPVNWYVYPITADAMGAFDVTVSSSNITITYNIAPPSGSSNLKWSWFADVY